MKRFVRATLGAGCLVLSTQAFADAEDAGVFDKWLGQTAPECLPVSAIKSVSTVTDLTAEQFEFSRALCRAAPGFSNPSSRRPCGHGKFRRRRHARARRRWPSLRAVSRPRFHQDHADAGRRGKDRLAGHAAMKECSTT